MTMFQSFTSAHDIPFYVLLSILYVLFDVPNVCWSRWYATKYMKQSSVIEDTCSVKKPKERVLSKWMNYGEGDGCHNGWKTCSGLELFKLLKPLSFGFHHQEASQAVSKYISILSISE